MSIAITIARRIDAERRKTGSRPTSVRVTTDELDELRAFVARFEAFPAESRGVDSFAGVKLEVHDE